MKKSPLQKKLYWKKLLLTETLMIISHWWLSINANEVNEIVNFSKPIDRDFDAKILLHKKISYFKILFIEIDSKIFLNFCFYLNQN